MSVTAGERGDLVDNGGGCDDTLPIRQAADGDETAFVAVMRRMTPLIRAQIHQFEHLELEEEDLIQECRMGLLAAVRTYRPDGGAAFSTYATACMRNRLLSLARRYGSRAGREQPLETEADLPDAVDTDPAARLLEQEDALRLLEQLRQRLTPLEYSVLLARCGGRSYDEIAVQMNISRKSVDNAVQRLRRKLSTDN